jgi:hypothetical protein
MTKRSAIFVSFVLIAAFSSKIHAQYPFGKNKVIYTSRDWKILETEHVDIYHYPSERNLVLSIAPVVEETFAEYEALFNLEFKKRLPLVIYSSHYDFQQTNIIPWLIPEYTAGFTDLVKGRVAIPFTGSMGDLRHVIRHEMVHAFMLEKLRQVMNSRRKFSYASPPLWFVEGLAEYVASPDANSESRMFVRDALLHEKLPDLENIWRIYGSFLMYKEGEAVVRFIARNFGEKAPILILENWWKADKFSTVLKASINMNISELSDAFMKSIKRRYYPQILHRVFATENGTRLTPPRSFHSRPCVRRMAGNELEIYAICARQGTINICRIRSRGRSVLSHETFIEGGRSTLLESIPALRSKIETKGDTLVFVSKSRARDVIYLWNISANRRIAAISFEHLSMISSPTLSPLGDKIVFSAIDTTGMPDLYLYDLASHSIDRLTHDAYSESNPDYHPFRDVVIFSSDRCMNSRRDARGIFKLDLATKTMEALTCSGGIDDYPEWAPDGEGFLFASDMDGSFDIYLYRDGIATRETSLLGGANASSFLPDGSGFVASCYYDGGFHLFSFPLKSSAGGRKLEVAGHYSSAPVPVPAGEEKDFVTRDYSLKLGLDLLGTGLAVDPDFGDVGNGAEILLSDILGNHQIYAFFGNTSEGFDDFWKRLNFGVTYVNLSHRLNYMLGVFHLTTFWGDYFSLFRSERRYGGTLGIRYPFSKFSRIEGNFILKALERENDFGGISLDGSSTVIASTFLSYVADNTVWTIGGPMKGTRYYIASGRNFDLKGRGFESTSLHIDLRKYLRITDRIVVAERFITRNSWGGDLVLFYLGGPWDLRGYDFRRFAGRSIYLFNNEIRFPLIDRFSLTFPFGHVEMPSIRGAFFFDAGKADRFITETGWLGSIGVGAELNLGYAPVIRVNFTRTTDFDKISSDTRFGLFIGYNY